MQLNPIVSGLTTRFCLNVLTLAAVSAFSIPAFPEAGLDKSQASSSIPEARIEAVERKLLQKAFVHDPMDKRLQRLELLLFGGTQYGSEEERWKNLQKAVSERDSQAKRTVKQPGSANDQAASLSTIEKEVLKKTFPQEATGKRLDRLEAKLFGQPSPNLSNDRRIERLRRTTGLADPLSTAESSSPFQGRPPLGFQALPGFPEFGQSDPQMAEMFREMERQMRSLNGLGAMPNGKGIPNFPNGTYGFRFYYQTPDGKSHVFQSPQGKPNAESGPKMPSKPTIPGLRAPDMNEIPPYGDPNMI